MHEEIALIIKKVKQIVFDNFKILGHIWVCYLSDGKRGFYVNVYLKILELFLQYQNRLLDEIISYNDSLRDDLDKFLMNFKR